jgi:hypothetical protein
LVPTAKVAITVADSEGGERCMTWWWPRYGTNGLGDFTTRDGSPLG